MSTKLDSLVREVTRCTPLQEPVCIHFPDGVRAQGLIALARYGFVLCTGDSLVNNPMLKHHTWFCLRTKSDFISKKGLYVTTIDKDWMDVNKGRYKLRIRAEDYVYNNFRRYSGA